MPDVERTGRVKGAVVRPMLSWCARQVGDDAVAAIAERLPQGLAAAVNPRVACLGVLPTSWYDERLAGALTRGVLESVARVVPRDEALRAIGRETVDASLGALSRALVAWFASPYASAMTAPVVWRLYHDTGSVSARVEGNAMFAICRDWVAHDDAWCRLVGACATRVLEINGCQGPQITAQTCSGGKGLCAMTLGWEALR